MKNLKEEFRKAKEEKRAIGQFNFSSYEQLKGIAKASKKLDVPVICGTSTGEAGYFGIEEAVSLIRAINEKEKTSLYLNYDHGKDVNILKHAIDCGYNMVHFDGSDIPYEEAVKGAIEVVNYAKSKDVVVEGEISKIYGKSTVSEGKIEETTLTSIEKIVKFVRESGVDCVALDIGNVHGVHKDCPEIKKERVSDLLDLIDTFVVLHGGSGISNEDIKEVIEKGIVKININTEIRLRWRDTLIDSLKSNPEEMTPYKILPFVEDAVFEKVTEKINLFNN